MLIVQLTMVLIIGIHGGILSQLSLDFVFSTTYVDCLCTVLVDFILGFLRFFSLIDFLFIYHMMARLVVMDCRKGANIIEIPFSIMRFC